MNALETALYEVQLEILRAQDKFPTWPTDPIHAAMVVNEESGELSKAVLQNVYERSKSSREELRKEAVQTAVTAVRFLLSLDRYDFSASDQHPQHPAEME